MKLNTKSAILILALAFSALSATSQCACTGLWRKLVGVGDDARHVALRTNMLYDVLAVPNLGLEIGVGAHASVNASWALAWWSNAERHRYWRVNGGVVEARWWPAEDWRGHHVGAYGQMLTYDMQLGNCGVMAPHWSWAAGIAYGYTIPVHRRLSIDLSIGVGYLGGKYHSYETRCGEYRWRSTHRHHYVGPTNIEVSLVWQLGRPNIGYK